MDDVTYTLKKNYGYSDSVVKQLLYSGGLSIYTTQDPTIQKIVDTEVNDEANYSCKKYSLDWRWTLKKEDAIIQNYSEKDLLKYIKQNNKTFNGLFTKQEDATKYIEEYKNSIKEENDKVLGEIVNFILEPQVSFSLIDQHIGEVLALSGGRGEKVGSRSLNRAVDTYRQPGSTFKVLASFAPALEECQETLAKTYYDSEYTNKDKTFKNWYSQGYLGYQNIRAGIIYSLNIIALRCLVETVTPEVGVEFAKKLGITSLSKEDYNPSSALGGVTLGVSNLELTNAFACIANEGVYNTPKLFTKVVDNKGNILINNEDIISKEVLSKENAFLLTDAMRESLIQKRAFAGMINVTSTSTREYFSKMSIAGKSGTTSLNNDVWFVGYTPYYTAGVWGGCDENQSLEGNGVNNGGTKYHKDIWRKIMEKIHKDLPKKEFVKPENIISVSICQKSGLLPTSGCKQDLRGDATYKEYFIKGTEPTTYCKTHAHNGKIIFSDAKYYGLITDDVYYLQAPDEIETPIINNDNNVLNPNIPISNNNNDFVPSLPINNNTTEFLPHLVETTAKEKATEQKETTKDSQNQININKPFETTNQNSTPKKDTSYTPIDKKIDEKVISPDLPSTNNQKSTTPKTNNNSPSKNKQTTPKKISGAPGSE